MASITAAVCRVKDELPQRISEALVNQACESAQHRWRERVLRPVVVIRLFVLQVLWGNVSCRTVTLTLVVNPLRPNRHEPRVIKRRKDRCTYMTKPREELRKALGITKIEA